MEFLEVPKKSLPGEPNGFPGRISLDRRYKIGDKRCEIFHCTFLGSPTGRVVERSETERVILALSVAGKTIGHL